MVYKKDFIYKIHCGTHVTYGVTDNIVGRGCHGSIPGWVVKKEKKKNTLYMYYISYMSYILYISYMHIIYLIYCIYM